MPVFSSRMVTTPPSGGGKAAGLVRAAVVLLPTLAVAACGDPSKFAPPCPQAAIVTDAADLVRYRAAGAGRDVTDMVLDGRITGISGSCSAGEHGATMVSMTVALDVTRGPAARGRQADVTYFVAVAKGEEILDKQDYPLHVEFPANTDVVHVTGAAVVMTLPTTPAVSGAAYSVLTGFQLSPEELAANRSRRAVAPGAGAP